MTGIAFAGLGKLLMAFELLFAGSPFSVPTPQGGSRNVIFVGSGDLAPGDLCRTGWLTTLFFLGVFLVVETLSILLLAG